MSEILPQPEKPNHISAEAQWLAGQGAGSWFFLSKHEDARDAVYRIVRYSPLGKVECDALFEVNNAAFTIKENYQFTYLSHCAMCTVIQHEHEFLFRALS